MDLRWSATSGALGVLDLERRMGERRWRHRSDPRRAIGAVPPSRHPAVGGAPPSHRRAKEVKGRGVSCDFEGKERDGDLGFDMKRRGVEGSREVTP
jgi:hypothetical protein